MRVERFADQLIEAAHCSSSGISAVYRFLLRAFGGNETSARAEFIRYLRGDLSPQMIQLARIAVKTDGHLANRHDVDNE